MNESVCRWCGLTDKEHCDPDPSGNKTTRHFFDAVRETNPMAESSEPWRIHITEKTAEESVVMFTQGVSVRSVAAVHHDVGVWLQEVHEQARLASRYAEALTRIKDEAEPEGMNFNQAIVFYAMQLCAEVAMQAEALNPSVPSTGGEE